MSLPPLLELTRVDALADALRARRSALPERSLLAACRAELAELERGREEREAAAAELGVQERQLAADVADATERARAAEEALYSGRVTAPRELESLQQELAGLRRRQRELEDRELAMMEQQEETARAIAALERHRAELETRAEVLRDSLAAAEADIDAELARVVAERAAVVPDVAEKTLATYERLRGSPRLAGNAAVRLQGSTCGGCRTGLPIDHVERIRRGGADAAIQCPRCARLVLP